MPTLIDPRFWLVVILFTIWAFRAARALKTLKYAPAVIPEMTLQPEKVSVVIPAKNEESNIEACVRGFLAQESVALEIIVANDNSTDKTEEILKSFGDKIKCIQVPPTPADWTGKNFAIHNAVSHATGDWLLFTDADTRHEPLSVASGLAHAKGKNIRFLSLLPKCLAKSFFELMMQPIAMSFTGLWFPLEKINNPDSKVFFANGQYILMDRKLYKTIGGHAAVKETFLEDFAMMENAKTKGHRCEVALGMAIYGTRMYDSFAAIWRGWRRIFLHAFRKQPKALIARFFSLIFASVLPFTFYAGIIPSALRDPMHHGFLFGTLTVLILLILGTSWKAYDIVKANRFYCIFHPIAACILAMIFLDAFWMAISGKKTVWR